METTKARITFRCHKEMVAFRPEQRELRPELMAEMVRQVVDAVSPDKVVLFGSRARGDHRPDSDIDLLIIKDSSLPRSRRSVDIHAALQGLPIEVDTEVVVYTPREVEEWKGSPAAFVTTALREGKVLYEK
jgi:predicted nucleotidyltransferase